MRSSFITLITLVFCSCSVTAKVPAGVYEGRYYGGVERMELHEGGAFEQTFKRGEAIVFHSVGKWRISPSNSKIALMLDVITLDVRPLLEFSTHGSFPEKNDNGHLLYDRITKTLSFDDEHPDYFLKKL